MIPVVTGLAFEAPPPVSHTPLCHKDVVVESESFMDVKGFLTINTLCPTMLPNPINRRKMAFTVNPYRSESLTLSDGVMLTRCMVARGIVMAHSGINSGIDTTQKKISSTFDTTQKHIVATIKTIISKSLQILQVFMAFSNERFTFADHVLPEEAGFSKGIALVIAAIFAFAALALDLHQRALAKLSQDDSERIAKAKAELKKTKVADDASNNATENIMNEISENVQSSELPSITEEQEEPISIEKDSRETDSVVTDDESTLIRSPPPTPRSEIGTLANKLRVTPASPKKRRRFFRLRRKKKN